MFVCVLLLKCGSDQFSSSTVGRQQPRQKQKPLAIRGIQQLQLREGRFARCTKQEKSPQKTYLSYSVTFFRKRSQALGIAQT